MVIEYNTDLTRLLRDSMIQTKKMGFGRVDGVKNNASKFARAISNNHGNINRWESGYMIPDVHSIAKIYEFALRRYMTELPIWLDEGVVLNYTVNDKHTAPIEFNPTCIDDIANLLGKPKDELVKSCNGDKSYNGNKYRITLIGKIYRVGLDRGYDGELWIPKSE